MKTKKLNNAVIEYGRTLSKRILNASWAFFLLTGVVSLSIGILGGTSDAARTLKIAEGDEWHYSKGREHPSRNWTHNHFDDSGWERGRSGFGYGNSRANTFLGDMYDSYARVYARREFTVNNPGAVTSMKLSVICDGPFVAYLNGIEVLKNPVGLPIIGHEGDNVIPLQIDITGIAHELHKGLNTVGMQCDNDDMTSGDYSFIPFFEIIEQ